MKNASVLFIFAFVNANVVSSVDSSTYGVLVKNVKVPREKTVLDSVSSGRCYYSGEVTFDFESSTDSVPIHVYLEDVPFQRYYLTNRSSMNPTNGNAHFRLIDSLCSGDVGWTKPKKGCLVHWRYSTENIKNHCRIKIGTGNYLYAHTRTEAYRDGEPIYLEDYRYNNIGLIAQFRRNVSAEDLSYMQGTQTPRYTVSGQLIVDDTVAPFETNAYDEEGRAVFRQQANSSGTLVNYRNSYVYDSLSRAVQTHYLQFGATADNPGTPVNIEYYTFDKANRIIQIESGFGCIVYSCDPVYEFDGKETFKIIYKDDSTSLRDSVVRELREDARNGKLVSRIINRYLYRPDGFIGEIVTISQGLDDPGTCWGFKDDKVGKTVYSSYDSLGYCNRSDSYNWNLTDSLFVFDPPSRCYRREYDAHGNTVKQFDFCDEDEKLRFTAKFNEFNHITLMEEINIKEQIIAYHYTWDLINLDEQEEFLHDENKE